MTLTQAARPRAASQKPSAPAPARIAGFDGIRALAFLAVFANHKLTIPQRDALGSVGVWSFFVLSGFLITRILAQARAQVETGRAPVGAALRRFYLRRTARIFPVYYAMLSVALILSAFVFVDDFWGKEKLAYIFYATNFLIGMRDGWIGDFGHLWSLAVEEQYYLLFAPLVLMLPRRRTAAICLAMVGTALVVAIALHAMRAPPLTIYVNSLVNFGILGFGGLVGLSAAGSRAPRWASCGAAQAAVLAVLIGAPLAFGAVAAPWKTYGPLISLLSGLLLFQIYNRQDSWLVALLETAPLRLTGRVSYAAYLFHPFIHFSTLNRVLGAAGVALVAPKPVQILAELAATLLLCAISWRVLESPVISWAGRISGPAGVQPRALTADAARAV